MDRHSIDILKDNYQMHLIDFMLLRDRGSRKVWYIRTDRGEFCFKKYDKELAAYEFSFALYEYLLKKRFHIPRLLKNTHQHAYSLDRNRRVYALFEWIKGSYTLDPHQRSDLKRGLSTLGRFHRTALSFTPPPNIKGHDRYRIHTSKFTTEIEKLKNLEPHFLGKQRIEFHNRIVENAHSNKKRIDALVQSGLLEEEARKGYIAHNDFADINLLATANTTYMIDLDDVAYNFPIIDFEMLYIKTCGKQLITTKQLPSWFKYYEEVSPLSPVLKRFLIYKLQMPTMYYRLLQHQISIRRDQQRYLEIYNWELEKNNVLQSLL